MHWRRLTQGRGGYEDLLDLPRHLAHLHRYDELADFAEQATQVLPGRLATAAYLADIRPLLPTDQRAATVVADLELQAVIATGNLTAAIRLAQTIHEQTRQRTAADPTDTDWQRDLSVSHNKLGDLVVAAGDLTAAGQHYTASLAIVERLAATWPDAFLLDLAQALVTYGVYLTELGHHDEALTADRRAVKLYLGLQSQNLERFGEATQKALTNLMIDLRNLGRSEEQAQQELERLVAGDDA